MICNKCETEKDLSEFSKASTKLGYKRQCKACWREYMKQYYKHNPEKYTKHKGYVKNNDFHYKITHRRHGLTDEQFAGMLNKYEGKCWSCQRNDASCVDHDHLCCAGSWSCGDCVRGLLCNGCNSALGHVNDQIDALNNLIAYLQAPRVAGGHK